MFDDIKIMGVLKDKTYKPDEKLNLFNIYFNLSSKPPIEWAQIFSEEHQSNLNRREAEVEGKYIKVRCCLDEVNNQLEELKRNVVNTNEKYRKYLTRQEIKKNEKQEQADSEQSKIDKALDGLDFG